jgi:Uma2 family endonuclease
MGAGDVIAADCFHYRATPMMNPILELAEARRRISPISVEEYHRFGEYNINRKRTELVRGIVLEKPRKTPRHSYMAMGLVTLALRVVPSGFHARINDPLTFRDSEPEPDLAVVRGSDDDYWEAHPSTAALAIEIVDGSPELERALASMYAEASVDEYWIVLAAEGAVEVYRRPVNDAYEEKFSAVSGENLTCMSVPNLAIPVHEIFN